MTASYYKESAWDKGVTALLMLCNEGKPFFSVVPQITLLLSTSVWSPLLVPPQLPNPQKSSNFLHALSLELDVLELSRFVYVNSDSSLTAFKYTLLGFGP